TASKSPSPPRPASPSKKATASSSKPPAAAGTGCHWSVIPTLLRRTLRVASLRPRRRGESTAPPSRPDDRQMDPVVRSEVLDPYWRFAAERQTIFFRRLRGDPPPWSDDPILQTYKFCNAYRASDRVSQLLIREVIYQPGFSPEDTFLRIVLF